MDLKISFSFLSLLRNSSSWRSTGIILISLLVNVSSHISEGLCCRFVTVIQYEKSILYTFDTFSDHSHFLWSPVRQVISFECYLSDFLLSNMSIRFYLQLIHVSGLSCRKSDSCHWLILMDVKLFSQWTHPILSFYFILIHVTFIYAMNWMIFFCIFSSFLLMSI